jgi:hypothetical protein
MLTKIGQRQRMFHVLTTELAIASRHLHFFKALWHTQGNFGKMPETRDFWYATASAHMKAALLQLCRVYDHDEAGINLLVFLRKVQTDWSKEVGQTQTCQQLNEDITICGPKPSCEKVDRHAFVLLVRKLRKWRNNIIAHYNYEVGIFDAQEFRSRNRWELSEIQELIDQAVVILNRYTFSDSKDIRYADWFDGKTYYETAENIINRWSAATNKT